MTLRDIDPARLYSLEELVECLPGRKPGTHLRTRTLMDWIKAGKLEAIWLGKHYGVTGAAFLNCLAVPTGPDAAWRGQTVAQRDAESRRIAAELQAKWAKDKRPKRKEGRNGR